MYTINSNPKFHHPYTMIVSGSTGAGKTQWLMRFLAHRHRLITKDDLQVLYCYGETNEYIMELDRDKTVATHQGIPQEQQIKDHAAKTGGKLLLVLDDLLLNMKSTFLDTLFTKGSHNWGVSVVMVTQSLFARDLRMCRQNSHYIVLMRNPAGELQTRNLGIQLFSNRLHYFMEAYEDATRNKFGYLLIDMHPLTDVKLRLRARIFPGETTIVYIPKY